MKNIAHFEKRYVITKEGQVINLANNLPLKPILNSNGYYKVGLACGDGTHKQISVHTLVAKHFIPNPYDHKQVNHIDGDKSNNTASNLEWCSSAQNIEHAFKTKLRKGYMDANTKEALLERVLSGESVNDLALEVSRHPNTLHKMLRTTADRLGTRNQWDKVMRRRRKDVAIRNLEKINN